jgi:hypothetical protein
VNLVVDFDPFTIDFWHGGSSSKSFCGGSCYRGSPHEPDLPGSRGRDLGLKRRSRNPVIQYDNIIAAMHNIGIELYFLRPIQIALPPEWIAIILHVSGIGPVGASKDKITELPP